MLHDGNDCVVRDCFEEDTCYISPTCFYIQEFTMIFFPTTPTHLPCTKPLRTTLYSPVHFSQNSLPASKNPKYHTMTSKPQSNNAKISTPLDLLTTGRWSDLILRCDGEDFYVHRSWVCMRSQTLFAASEGNFTVRSLHSYVSTHVGGSFTLHLERDWESWPAMDIALS